MKLFAGRLNFRILFNLRVIFWLVLIVAVGASIHKYALDNVGNFLIFRTSFYNLINLSDLYVRYPELHLDCFKYSPTFALLIGPVSILPELPGVIAWNLINTLPLFYAVKKLKINDKRKALILWIILVELVTSIQNCQSNGLYTALYLFTFVFFEKRQNFWAAFFVALTIFIKIFGGIAVILFVLYPGRLKFLCYLAFWMMVMALLPLTVVPAEHLVFLYKSWYALLTRDAVTLYGISFMGVVKNWFGIALPNMLAIFIGLVLFILPLVRTRLYSNEQFRRLFLCSLLIWTVIFNHKAESPMYIIAVAGVAIWYVIQKSCMMPKIFLWLTLIITSLSSTDIFPSFIRNDLVQPYMLKAVPCILIWFVIQNQLLGKIRANPEID